MLVCAVLAAIEGYFAFTALFAGAGIFAFLALLAARRYGRGTIRNVLKLVSGRS